MSEAIINIKEVCKSFGSVIALDNVTFNLNQGDFYGLLGPNGAGKTTLTRIITGLTEPDSGEVYVMGISTKNPIKVRNLMGIVPESESPPTFLTVEETLHLVCRIRDVMDLEKATCKWLDFFELEAQRNTLCRDLSKGQRQKLMLASSFIHEPQILLLDEPFINLDPIYQKKLRDYLLEYSSKGGTVLLCTHLLDIAEKLVNKVALLNRGKIIVSGFLDEIKSIDEHLEDAFIRLVKGS